MAIPTPPTCFPAEISSGRTTSSFEKSERFLPSSWIVTLKMRFVTASGRPVAVTGPAVERSGPRAFMRTVSTGMTNSCNEGPPW